MVRPPRLDNRRGDPVDPVPFFVVAGMTFMLAFSLGPMYGLAYGLSLGASLTASAAVFAGAGWVAYRQLVRMGPAVGTGPLPAGPRFERLVYGAIGLAVVLAALTLPLL